MRIWRVLTMGLRALLRRGEADRDVSDELRHFHEEARADMVARGATPDEARRAVRLRYGDPLPAREDVRGYGWEAAVGTLLSDLRLSVRGLRRSPAFTVVVVLTLGLGVGATTAIFSAVRPVLFEPLAYPGAERLVSVADYGEDGSLLPVTFGTYRELVSRSRVFSAVAVFKPWQPTLTGGAEPVRLEGQGVSASYFDVLGVAPARGPGFDPAQDHPTGAREVLFSDRLWRERFGAEPGVVGQAVRLDGQLVTVVGVMPEDFENVTAPLAQLWTLLQYDPLLPGFDTREWGRHLGMIGRLGPNVGLDDAVTRLDEIAMRHLPELPRPDWASLEGGFSLQRLEDAVVADVKPAMLVLLGAVVLLVGVTCANLTILLLARGSRRRGEFALRAALGARRRRLARYLMTEGLLLASLGGVLGLVVASVGLGALMAVAPVALPRSGAVGVDGAALLLALALTTLVGVMFGLAPGLHRAGAEALDLHDTGRGAVRRSRATRKALVVVEVALSAVLLVGAGLVLRSAERLFSQPLGLDSSDVLVMQVFATGLESGDAVTHGFFDQALDAVRGVPGVTSASLTTQLPLSGDIDTYGVVPDGAPGAEGRIGPAFRYAVSADYFTTMGVPLARGRPFEAGDGADGPRVAIVSRTLAGHLFPDEDPVGRRIRVGPPELEPYTVVGIAENVKQASLGDGPAPAVYVPAHQWHWADRVRWVVVRTEVDARDVLPAIRRAIWSVDRDQPVVRAQTMDALVARSEARRRFVMIVLSAFAASALAVAGIGLFGVLSGIVTERTREMGVRAALGASRDSIVSMVLAQGLALTAVGLVIGLAGALSASSALSTMLFEVTRFDPVTYGATAVLLAVGAACASALPALRAGRADPVDALRAE